MGANLRPLAEQFTGLWGVTGTPHWDWRIGSLRIVAAAIGLALFLAASLSTAPVTAAGGERTLWLYHTHTGKTGKFTYMRNGRYDTRVLGEMNTFLADWRTGSRAKMDPALFDLLWEVYQDVRGSQPYHIVSSYREPKTNAMLASKSSGVAENSQHMLGKAMDVFIPGVKLSTLRAAAMRHQVGGVGYYPTSGSPFVHMDTGNVRAWPRMTRAQLKDVFPDGKTLHLPTDGTPLSKDGRSYAQAQWSKCHMVPCGGAAPIMPADQPEIVIASLDAGQSAGPRAFIGAPTPLPLVGTMPQGASQPLTVAALPPVLPMAMPPSLMASALGGSGGALGAISAQAPVPRVLMTPTAQILSAYAEVTPDPGAQRALDMLIQRETAAADAIAEVAAPVPGGKVEVASIDAVSLDAEINIFDQTWTAVTSGTDATMLAALAEADLDVDVHADYESNTLYFMAPSLDNITETLVTPLAATNTQFAEFFAPEGYLDADANPWAIGGFKILDPHDRLMPGYSSFVPRATQG